jgi:hypothetical protein
MQPIADYKFFGLAAFVLIVFGLAFIILRWPQAKHMTFSQHVAVGKRSIVYYVALFSVVLPLLFLFFADWFTPAFHLSYWFTVFVTISLITQYVCTLIPEIGGWRTKYHRLLSGVSGILLVPSLLLIQFSDLLSIVDKGVIIAGFLVMLSVVYTVIKNKKQTYEPSYIHQSLYYIGFFVPILIISYL